MNAGGTIPCAGDIDREGQKEARRAPILISLCFMIVGQIHVASCLLLLPSPPSHLLYALVMNSESPTQDISITLKGD